MIDYVSGFFPCFHDPDKLFAGGVVSFDALYNKEWNVVKKLSVEGSYSSKIQLLSTGNNEIYFTGNPVKFLQGHNLFGTNDLKELLNKFFKKLMTYPELGLNPTDHQLDMIEAGIYKLTRVDVNETWHLKDGKDVLAWIRAIGETAYMKHRGRGMFDKDTLYFGKNSRRWALKCYFKGLEILKKGHQLPGELQCPEMMEYANKALRIEGVIRQLELKRRDLEMPFFWRENTATMLLYEFINTLELSDKFMLEDAVLNTLPIRLRLVYQAWLNHDDLKHIMSSSAFYRWRKQLLAYGIDIATASPKEKNNVIPLMRVLEAEPVGIPSWAYERNLVA